MTRTASAPFQFNVGDRVVHRRFANETGVVARISAGGTELLVKWDSGGQSWARSFDLNAPAAETSEATR